LRHRCGEGPRHIRIRRRGEADVTIADLLEGQVIAGFGGQRAPAEQRRARSAPADGPEDASARPEHAFRKPRRFVSALFSLLFVGSMVIAFALLALH